MKSAVLQHTDGRTDGEDQAIVFASTPKNKYQVGDDVLINGIRDA